MLWDKIFFQEKTNSYLTTEGELCFKCKKEIKEIIILVEDYGKKRSALRYYCQICGANAAEFGHHIEKKIILIVDKIPIGAKRIFLKKTPLIATNNISTFEAAEMKFEGVTEDKTVYANRSPKMQEINYEKRQQEIIEEIEFKDRDLSEKEALEYLNTLKGG